MDIRTYLQDNILLFDGAMGTLFAQESGSPGPCELANLTHSQTILDIHRDYLAAGCRAIKTNTFGLSRIAAGEAE